MKRKLVYFSIRRSAAHKTAIYGSIFLGLMSLALEAQPTDYKPNTCRVEPSDTTFITGSVTGSGGLAGDIQVCDVQFGEVANQPCQTVTATYNMTRVVGPGVNSQGATDNINTDGTLVNPSAYVENGVVSSYAYLQVAYAAGFVLSTTLHFTVNGQSLDNSDISIIGADLNPITPGGGGSLCLKIPISLIRFARRNIGGLPTPGQNLIQVSSTNPYATDIEDTSTVSVVFGTLNVEAMAPVLLVHGWASGPYWWGPPQNTAANFDNFCGVDRSPDGALNNSGIYYNFAQTLITARVPYDCARVRVDRNASIKVGGEALKNGLKPSLTGSFPPPAGTPVTVRTILDEFGTKHVNFVAHSKGGLWTRDFLPAAADGNPSTEVAVTSVTTIDTPHAGSLLADVVAYARQYPLSTFGLPIANWRQVIAFFRHDSEGTFDMTVAAAKGFNSNAETPDSYIVDNIKYTVKYSSIASDADVNVSTKLERNNGTPCSDPQQPAIINPTLCDEIFPMSRFTPYTYQQLRNYEQIEVPRTGILGHLIPQNLNPKPNATPQLNDGAVTVASALAAPSFQPVPGPASSSLSPFTFFQHNHRTVGASDVANAVLLGLASMIKGN